MADEVWAINAMGNIVQHDLLFAMDDCRVQESRAEANPGGNVAGLVEWLKLHPRFFTSRVYPEYPGAIAFPLADVVTELGTTYLNTTTAYAVAYAMCLQVQKISLFGVDFSYADFHKGESGRGCIEFLLGMATAKGIHISVPTDTSLFDANVDDRCKPYGYDSYDVKFNVSDTGITVDMTDRDVLPTPEEIEKRYRPG